MIEKHVDIIKELNLTPKTILEVGSRDGHDSKFYQTSFGIESENVFIVEPNPTQSKRIQEDYPNFKIFEYAISPNEGVLTFHQVINGGGYGMDPIGVSSLLNRTDDFYDRFETIQVDVKSIKGSTLMSMINLGIDICKIDVEGLSYEVIESFGETINNINTIHVETEHHQFWESQKLHGEVCKLLNNLGFRMVFEDRNPSQSDTIWINNKLYE